MEQLKLLLKYSVLRKICLTSVYRFIETIYFPYRCDYHGGRGEVLMFKFIVHVNRVEFSTWQCMNSFLVENIVLNCWLVICRIM